MIPNATLHNIVPPPGAARHLQISSGQVRFIASKTLPTVVERGPHLVNFEQVCASSTGFGPIVANAGMRFENSRSHRSGRALDQSSTFSCGLFSDRHFWRLVETLLSRPPSRTQVVYIWGDSSGECHAWLLGAVGAIGPRSDGGRPMRGPSLVEPAPVAVEIAPSPADFRPKFAESPQIGRIRSLSGPSSCHAFSNPPTFARIWANFARSRHGICRNDLAQVEHFQIWLAQDQVRSNSP